MGGREANNARHDCAIWPRTTHAQDTRAWENSQSRPKIAKFETHGLTLITLAESSPSPLHDPYSQPPLPSRPIHVAASYANISEHLTRFELQCFQQFDNIDATLQQSCQHLPISSLVPPREPSSDEDV
ncbi:hypothetical protein GOBAR_AA08654 [Gossypium barbadense]|uniref:Uncharacterized protein n=1 Tax=Gossypium barbadense TaxID=3634 RepID=A0A2P5Y8R6_GOSBA|nr:hypothetical protein GOBAR_AA08654 [Gossypium barbadense]